MRFWRLEFINGTKNGGIHIIHKLTNQLEVKKFPPWRSKSLGTLTFYLAVPL
jgi:hypothetical protein